MKRFRSPPRPLDRHSCGSPPRPIAKPRRDERALDDRQSPLEVVESREDMRTGVRLRGELDIVTAPAVARRIAVLRERHESVLLDLDGLTFFDASGVRLVLAAAEESRRDGWAFAVTRGSRPVRRVFQALELDGHLPYG